MPAAATEFSKIKKEVQLLEEKLKAENCTLEELKGARTSLAKIATAAQAAIAAVEVKKSK